MHYLKKDGIIIVNNQEIDPMPVIIGMAEYPNDIIDNLDKETKLVLVNALEEARELGNIRVVNTILLGALAHYLDFDTSVWEKAIENIVPAKTIDINIKAFRRGKELVD